MSIGSTSCQEAYSIVQNSLGAEPNGVTCTLRCLITFTCLQLVCCRFIPCISHRPAPLQICCWGQVMRIWLRALLWWPKAQFQAATTGILSTWACLKFSTDRLGINPVRIIVSECPFVFQKMQCCMAQHRLIGQPLRSNTGQLIKTINSVVFSQCMIAPCLTTAALPDAWPCSC